MRNWRRLSRFFREWRCRYFQHMFCDGVQIALLARCSAQHVTDSIGHSIVEPCSQNDGTPPQAILIRNVQVQNTPYTCRAQSNFWPSEFQH